MTTHLGVRTEELVALPQSQLRAHPLGRIAGLPGAPPPPPRALAVFSRLVRDPHLTPVLIGGLGWLDARLATLVVRLVHETLLLLVLLGALATLSSAPTLLLPFATPERLLLTTSLLALLLLALGLARLTPLRRSSILTLGLLTTLPRATSPRRDRRRGLVR